MDRLGEVAGVFLKIGTIGFGGPAAHVAMMREEIVVRRGWIDEQEFLDALGASSLLPGPGSTQMAMYLARRRAGWWGLLVGGACFILPAMTIVLLLAWAYVEYGATTIGRGLLYGLTPVVIGIIADAVLGLGRIAIRNVELALLAAAAAAGYFLDVNVLVLLLGAGAVELLVRRLRQGRLDGLGIALAVLVTTMGSPSTARPGHDGGGVALGEVFLEFLKLGAIVFGSGYVLLAFLQRDLVQDLHWLTARQLVDAVSIGQVTPGPVFTTATFVGYLVAGVWGGVVATFAIFLPSFLLVAAFGGLVPALRRGRWTAAALDGVNAAAVGLIVAVTWDLGDAAIVDGLTAVLAIGSFLVLLRWKVNYVVLLVAGAAVGVVHSVA
jgi:chromate transporter